jgi:hypothetical protein
MSYLDQLRAAESEERAIPPTLETVKTSRSSSFEGFEGHVLGPFQKIDTAPPLTNTERTDIHEAIEERAAIREFEGGASKAVAEHAARSGMRVYRVRVAMGPDVPDRWFTLIAPGADRTAAEGIACGQFGAARVVALVEHPAPG